MVYVTKVSGHSLSYFPILSALWTFHCIPLLSLPLWTHSSISLPSSLCLSLPLVLRSPPKCMRVFKLPELPASLSLLSIQRFYNELILQLGKAIFCVPPENSALLARYTTTLPAVGLSICVSCVSICVSVFLPIFFSQSKYSAHERWTKTNSTCVCAGSVTCVVSSTPCVPAAWRLWVTSRTCTRRTRPSSPPSWWPGWLTHCSWRRSSWPSAGPSSRDSSSRSHGNTYPHCLDIMFIIIMIMFVLIMFVTLHSLLKLHLLLSWYCCYIVLLYCILNASVCWLS